ncbi:hypothetical protein [Dyadobacter beijingensis]|uniref:hypothetical protein n=1 Tax=Dyadobacter beijingensis TaxID=365489 RepID=UPI00039CDB61|nr:hypothetical protein [Dyadobacter beijingensis]
MIILDAQLPPSLAVWITETFKLPCFSAQLLVLCDAEKFAISKAKNAIVITKDDDFVSFRKPANGDLANLRQYVEEEIKGNFSRKS